MDNVTVRIACHDIALFRQKLDKSKQESSTMSWLSPITPNFRGDSDLWLFKVVWADLSKNSLL